MGRQDPTSPHSLLRTGCTYQTRPLRPVQQTGPPYWSRQCLAGLIGRGGLVYNENPAARHPRHILSIFSRLHCLVQIAFVAAPASRAMYNNLAQPMHAFTFHRNSTQSRHWYYFSFNRGLGCYIVRLLRSISFVSWPIIPYCIHRTHTTAAFCD